MNPTHLLYKTLVETNPTFLQELEQAAQKCSPQEASERLPLLLGDQAPGDPLDYTRLYALLKKDFRDCDLRGEDFTQMPLSGFDFTNARLQGAQMQHADLSHAKLSSANLSELQACGVQMQHARLSDSVLSHAHWLDADCTCADVRKADQT